MLATHWISAAWLSACILTTTAPEPPGSGFPLDPPSKKRRKNSLAFSDSAGHGTRGLSSRSSRVSTYAPSTREYAVYYSGSLRSSINLRKLRGPLCNATPSSVQFFSFEVEVYYVTSWDEQLLTMCSCCTNLWSRGALWDPKAHFPVACADWIQEESVLFNQWVTSPVRKL